MTKLDKSRSDHRTGGVELVCFDAMFTLFRPVAGDRGKLIAGVYRQVGGLSGAVSDESLLQQIAKARVHHRDLRHDREYWQRVNSEVFLAFRSKMQRRGAIEQYALEVNRRIIRSAHLYEPDPEVVQVVRAVRRTGARVIIASNQETRNVTDFLRDFRLTELFDAVYTSESLKTRKPFQSFWQKLLKLEERRPSQTVHVGNSLNADIGAARLKIRTLIWDPAGQTAQLLRGRGRHRYVHPDMNDEQFQALLDSGYVQLIGTARAAEKFILRHGRDN